MHCYREAIRNVEGAYILYPGERAIVYPAHDATGPYDGVGALPLKPEARARPALKEIGKLVDLEVVRLVGQKRGARYILA